MNRPSESIQAIVGSVLGACLIIAGAFLDVSKITPQVMGAAILLVSWVATAVTWYVARRQRAGLVLSATDGKVFTPTQPVG